jgi:hypothetical protein
MLYDTQRVKDFMDNTNIRGSLAHRKAVVREVIGQCNYVNVCGFYSKIGDFPPLFTELDYPRTFLDYHCDRLTPRQLPFMRLAVINHVMCPEATTEAEVEEWYAYFYPTFKQQVKNFFKALTKLGRKQENN